MSRLLLFVGNKTSCGDVLAPWMALSIFGIPFVNHLMSWMGPCVKRSFLTKSHPMSFPCCNTDDSPCGGH
jgi:hypothetical protein